MYTTTCSIASFQIVNYERDVCGDDGDGVDGFYGCAFKNGDNLDDVGDGNDFDCENDV